MIDKRTRKIVVIGILAALAWIISQFSFPLLPWAPFLKIDFSDIPVVLGMYIFGPLSGIAIAAVRSLLSYVMTGGEAGFPIGDTAAFIATLSYTLPVYYIIRNRAANMKTVLMASSVGTVSLTTVLALLNWLVIAPLYIYVMGFSVGPMREYLTISVIPFNLLKGAFVSIIFF
ncbi:MAG TPA: ECF transporter S component, partial [Atopostipes sp.]|nr:ECF transporter S component [Atopostipes sp.]